MAIEDLGLSRDGAEAVAGGLAAKKSGVGGAAAGCMYWDLCKAGWAVTLKSPI